jgi:hypothetical protein
MAIFAVIVYIAVLAVSWLLGRIAKLPIINIGNAAFGAVVGAAKAVVGVWAVLYVVLFFPLPADLHNDSTILFQPTQSRSQTTTSTISYARNSPGSCARSWPRSSATTACDPGQKEKLHRPS